MLLTSNLGLILCLLFFANFAVWRKKDFYTVLFKAYIYKWQIFNTKLYAFQNLSLEIIVKVFLTLQISASISL